MTEDRIQIKGRGKKCKRQQPEYRKQEINGSQNSEVEIRLLAEDGTKARRKMAEDSTERTDGRRQKAEDGKVTERKQKTEDDTRRNIKDRERRLTTQKDRWKMEGGRYNIKRRRQKIKKIDKNITEKRVVRR